MVKIEPTTKYRQKHTNQFVSGVKYFFLVINMVYEKFVKSVQIGFEFIKNKLYFVAICI